MRYEIGVLKGLFWLVSFPFRWLWQQFRVDGREQRVRIPKRWRWVIVGWAALAILATIPQIGIAVLNSQSDAECSVIVDGQQQMVYGRECDRHFPE